MKYVYGKRYVRGFRRFATSTVATLAILANSAGVALPVFLSQRVAADSSSTVVISGNTTAVENTAGKWMFNRDVSTSTPFEFNEDEKTIGIGSVNVKPIGANAADKFIAEYFAQEKMGDIDAVTYDFKIGSGGDNSDYVHFYMNVYANFEASSPTKFYDCRYNIVPTTGSTSNFTTVTFDPDVAYSVATSGSSPTKPCPAKPADMGNKAVVRAFALNVGDTSASDVGLDGYLDKFVLDAKKTTTFDLDPVGYLSGNGKKLRICHATASEINPYNNITIALSAVTNTHLTHQNNEDIIPPFAGAPDGVNWTTENKALWEDNCGDGQVLGDSCEPHVGAIDIVDYEQGTTKNGGAISVDRTDPLVTLGASDGKFFSLGKVGSGGGWIVLDMGGYVVNNADNDLTFVEITNGTYPLETAKVEVSKDGTNWSPVTSTIENNGGNNGFDLEAAGLNWIRYVRVTDTTNYALHNNQADGYDLDAVQANVVCEEPKIPEVCREGNVIFMIGDEETDQLQHPADEFTGSGNPGDFSVAHADPFVVGTDSDDEFPWNSNFSQGYGLDFDVEFNYAGPDITAAELVVSWSPGKSAKEDKKVYLDGNLIASFSRTGTSVAGWYNQSQVYQETVQFPLTAGEHALRFTHTSGDGTFWDYVKLTQADCDDPEEPEVPTATVMAAKIICDEESDLPNWGAGGDDITSTTATDWMTSEGANKGCYMPESWDYQYRLSGEAVYDGSYGELGGDWKKFTNDTEIELDGNTTIQLREVLPEGYIPFAGWTTDQGQGSAEFYCANDVLNYDNWEWIQNPQDGATYYCVAWNVEEEPEVLASDVELCKVDGQQRPLANWTLMLLGEKVEDVVVPANTSAGANTTTSLETGISYVAIAEGTWENQRSPLNTVDAEYSTEDNWATKMDGFTGFGTEILELQINQAFDPNSNWGAYNSDHRYAQGFTMVANGSANFRIYDGSPVPNVNESWYGDNSGELEVAVYRGYAGITGEDGCVTFEDVPHGDYMVDEIMQDGWEYVGGVGEVEVNSESNQFFVVNESIEDEEEVLGSIAGLIFNDENGNQAQDGEEEPLSGWTVWLLTQNSPWKLVGVDTTDENGQYTFEELAVPGTYYVCQNLQDGWFQTLLDNAGFDGLDIGDANVGDIIGDSEELDSIISEFCYRVELDEAEANVADRDFGNLQEGGNQLGTCDIDGDGIADENCEGTGTNNQQNNGGQGGQVLAASTGLAGTGSELALGSFIAAFLLATGLLISRSKRQI